MERLSLERLTRDPAVRAAYVILLLGVAAGSLSLFLRERVYLFGPDAFYYISIADSWNETGTLRDLTALQDRSLRTPQNAVVFAYAALARLGLEREAQIASISLVNFVLHVLAAIPLMALARRVGLVDPVPRAALLALYLGSFHLYRWQLLAYNDGAFNALSLWLAWLLVGVLQASDGEPRRGGRAGPWVALVALSAILVHFRLNALLALGAAIPAALAVRRFRLALALTAVVGVAIASITLPYAASEGVRMGNQLTWIQREVGRGMPSAVTVFQVSVPAALFRPLRGSGAFLYLPFAIAMLWAALRGLREREPGLLYVVVSSLAAIGFLIVYSAQPERYLIYVVPLMYVPILLWPLLRPIGVLFATAAVASTLVTFATGVERRPVDRFWLHVYERGIRLPAENALLYSHSPQRAYFFLGTPSLKAPLAWETLARRGAIYLVGDGAYLDSRRQRVAELAREAGARVGERSLTPDYEDGLGYGLIELRHLGPARPAGGAESPGTG